VNLDWTGEQAEFRDAVRGFAQNRLTSIAADLPRDRPLSRSELDGVITALAKSGVVDEIPTGTDGSVDWIALAIVAEELWRADGSLGFVLTQRLTGRLVLEPFLVGRAVAAWPASDAYLCAAITEPDVGSNPAAVTTRARSTDGGWRIDGTKLWISGASLADVCIALCRVVDDDTDRVAAFLVPTDAPGWRRARGDACCVRARALLRGAGCGGPRASIARPRTRVCEGP